MFSPKAPQILIPVEPVTLVGQFFTRNVCLKITHYTKDTIHWEINDNPRTEDDGIIAVSAFGFNFWNAIIYS